MRRWAGRQQIRVPITCVMTCTVIPQHDRDGWATQEKAPVKKPIDDVRQISAMTYGFMALKALFAASNSTCSPGSREGTRRFDALAAETGIALNRLRTPLTILKALGLVTETAANSPTRQRRRPISWPALPAISVSTSAPSMATSDMRAVRRGPARRLARAGAPDGPIGRWRAAGSCWCTISW